MSLLTKAQVKPLPALNLQGHRGCRGLLPENTIPAFLKAIDLGVSTLEMDVVITKDNQVLVSHEAFFSHELTSKNGLPITVEDEKKLNIYQLTYAETQQYDVGLLPHKRFTQQQKIPATKPLLDSVIKAVKAYCALHKKPLPFFNIETKCLPETDDIFHPAPTAFVHALMQVIEKNTISHKLVVQSFDRRTLQVMHASYPSIPTALLIESDDALPLEQQIKLLGFTPTIYSPFYALVNTQLVKDCATLHMKLIPWTVNDIATMKRLILMGVDGIISDYPNLFSSLND